VAPIVAGIDLPWHPVYLVLAIGCGSKLGMWMNDSGFWTIARMGGLTEAETLRTASVMITLEGFVGLIATMILAAIWPLA
jgi:GntP family gluconate:H+ symporter